MGSIFSFAICIPSLVRYLLRSLVYFLIGLFDFLLSSFKSSLYIVDNSCPLDASFTDTFFQSVTWYCLSQRSFQSWWSPACQLFLSWIMSLVLYLKSHHHTHSHLDSLFCRHQAVLWFCSLHLVLWSILSYFLLKPVVRYFYMNVQLS